MTFGASAMDGGRVALALALALEHCVRDKRFHVDSVQTSSLLHQEEVRAEAQDDMLPQGAGSWSNYTWLAVSRSDKIRYLRGVSPHLRLEVICIYRLRDFYIFTTRRYKHSAEPIDSAIRLPCVKLRLDEQKVW